MAELPQLSCVRESALVALVGLSGGDGNLQVILLACLVGREAAPGENTFGVLTTLTPAMNQKNSFAAMTGRGLGHSPKGMSWEQPSHGSRLPSLPV